MDNLTSHQIQTIVKKTANVHDIKVVTNDKESYVLIYTSPKAKKPAYKFPLSWITSLLEQYSTDFDDDIGFDFIGEPPTTSAN